MTEQSNDLGVAVIGMAGRFPQSDSVAQFWQNLRAGRECISEFDVQEIIRSGVAPEIVKRADYVRRKGAVADIDCFDAPFFSIAPREAELTDPQHRLMLEGAWHAMEDAGYDPLTFKGDIGVFAGKSLDSYLMLNVLPTFKKVFSSGSLQAAIGNDKDSMTTQIAYHLNLRGPAITIQTSSSTSLVAICSAAQSLLTWQCDMALAGGVTLGPPIHSGYLSQEGGITSHDGHCRTFDIASTGFVPGTGLGLVVLKRLDEAIRDRDNIISVIRGFAVNNDGSAKVSYTAPSVDAQVRAITTAHAMAGWSADDISYIEAHGTGTRLGDPIEVTALTKAFRQTTKRRSFCWLGSVKTNVGHMDTAAGVTGFIKASLCLQNAELPPSINYETPNPACDFPSSPFKIVQKLESWKPESGVRRAGVTSLGMGGTNAHVVLEQAPEMIPRSASSQPQIYVVSARSEAALFRQLKEQARGLAQAGNLHQLPQDVAFTLAVGRHAMPWRAAVVSSSVQEASIAFNEAKASQLHFGQPGAVKPITFLFSGQGSQYAQMAASLYQHEPVYRQAFNQVADITQTVCGPNLKELLYGSQSTQAGEEQLADTSLTQPALFAVEYALAQLWLDRGIRPTALIGHSLGEWVAAVLAGVMSLQDAVRLVNIRGRVMAASPHGVMLSVRANKSALLSLLNDEVELAADNAPGLCVLAGQENAVEVVEKQLDDQGIRHERLRTSHAFHSKLMCRAASELLQAIQDVDLKAPSMQIISTALGRAVTDQEITDPYYWSEQMLRPVLFKDAVVEASQQYACDFLEIGPGSSLATMAILGAEPSTTTYTSLPKATEGEASFAHDRDTLARLWAAGHPLDWQAVFTHHACARVSLPGYAFEKIRYWISSPEEHDMVENDPVSAQTPTVKTSSPFSASSRKTPRPDTLSTSFEPAASKIEQQISEVLEDLLGISGIGRQDDFFEMGGHSLMASMAIARLSDQMGVEIDAQTFFSSPTVADLATRFEHKETVQGESLVDSLLTEIEEEAVEGEVE
ncbi:acyltransferase domain-containing protein [Vibrio parahaemolyticus]|nr:acyltransferase domain-containing protein [Vibrio parahaemolyticus]ELC3209715.1 acyltransferase domain-containing protein [Vibrio parahaemolyticus]